MKKRIKAKNQSQRTKRQKNYGGNYYNCNLNLSSLPSSLETYSAKNFTTNSNDNDYVLVFVDEKKFDPELCQFLSNLLNKTVLVAVGEASS